MPPRGAGPDGSLAFYLHPEKGDGLEDDPEEGGFYRLVCDYSFGEGGFSLAYLGANIARQPLELESWPLIAQTAGEGGPGWQHVTVAVERGLIELFLNGSKLNERSIRAERAITDIANVDAGYAGVYAGHIGEEGTAEARIDASGSPSPERRQGDRAGSRAARRETPPRAKFAASECLRSTGVRIPFVAQWSVAPDASVGARP